MPASPSRARLVEPAAVLLAWALLAGLHAARGPLDFEGVLGAPFLSVFAAVFALLLAPGFVLWRWLVGGPWRHAPAWSFGLGLVWTLVIAAAGMTLGASLDHLLGTVVVLNGALSAAFAVTAWRGAAARTDDDGPGPRPSAWVVAAACVVLARVLDLGTRRLHRLTYGSDEWPLMAAVRSFLEAPTAADPAQFDVCDLVIALLVRLSRVEVFDVYRLHLPPILIVAGALALLVLAEAVLRDRNAAWTALAVQGLYALSEMYPRGEGMGMAMIVRVVEDKYVALLVALPLAQAAFLAALRRGGRRALALFAFSALGATLLQPFAVPWLALGCGVTYLAALATSLVPRSRRLMIAVGAVTAGGLAAAWLLRALRPSRYFVLYDPTWPFNASLLELSARQLLILSLEKGWYMAHPWLLTHPLVQAALLASLLLARRARSSVEAQFLLLSTWVPVLLAFNPLTAVALGRLVTPWRLYRLLWVMPVALVLAWALTQAAAAARRRLSERRPALAGLASGPLVAAALAVAAGLLSPRMTESARAYRARNHVLVKPAEKEFLRQISQDDRLGGVVLAPEGLSIRIPAWTTRLQPLCGLVALREREWDLVRRCAAFHEAAALGPPELGLLRERGVRYVIAEASSPVEAPLRAHPLAFRPLLRGEELALYEWRPERWTGR